jgi:predicted amidohydrolase YtcJ
MSALRRILAIFMTLGLLALLTIIAWSVLGAPGRTVYLGGSILTMDADDRIVEALAVDGERIAAVGSETELRRWAEEKGAKIVDLEGRALLPGFIDAHGHFPGSGITEVFVDLNSPPIGNVERIDDLVALLSERASETGAGEWILGIGYDDTLLEERRHPTRRDLDRASTEHPIAVLHISGHLASVNSAGLDALGFDADTPDPEGGLIRRDPATGEPDGVLEETAMQGFQSDMAPGMLDAVRIVRAAVRDYLAQGVTTAQSGAVDGTVLGGMSLMSRLGMVPLRLILWPLPETADAILAGELEPPDGDPLRVRVGAVKLITDGSIQGYTGYLSEPYHVPPGDDPEYRGYPRIPRDELFELVARYHAAGLQLAMHGNGDASIEDILDAYEQAQRDHPREDARPIVIHAQMTRDDQLDRMAELGVIPSFFSLHTFYWGDRHRNVFMGPERAARMSPAAGARDRGIRFTIHADTPVVPMEPLRLVWSAVNRKTRSGFVVGPEQRISVMQALRAVTIDAAHQHFEEGEKGSLEPGKLADLVILSRSPLDDPATIDRIEVVETIIGGRSEYRAPETL